MMIEFCKMYILMHLEQFRFIVIHITLGLRTGNTENSDPLLFSSDTKSKFVLHLRDERDLFCCCRDFTSTSKLYCYAAKTIM